MEKKIGCSGCRRRETVEEKAGILVGVVREDLTCPAPET